VIAKINLNIKQMLLNIQLLQFRSSLRIFAFALFYFIQLSIEVLSS